LYTGVVKELQNHIPDQRKTLDLSNATTLISTTTKVHVEVVNELLARDN